ncbi:hypothetical protein Bca101_073776 [Brassica carinata]
MMSRKYSTADNGKTQVSCTSTQPRKRIKAPDFDTSALIKENSLTLVGRVTNLQEQPLGDLIFTLPRKWVLKGKVSGSDLGLDTFQFRFELEEDLIGVLAKKPYHYAHWMVILQRWEPILSPQFPSEIPFWIRLHGLPLHNWHEKMIYTISQELGALKDYNITKTSAKMRLRINGLAPITKETIVDLCHLAKYCPTRIPIVSPNASNNTNWEGNKRTSPSHRAAHRKGTTRTHPRHSGDSPSRATPFHQRVDRHGRTFGERIPLLISRASGPRNKITPQLDADRDTQRDDNAPHPLRAASSPQCSRARSPRDPHHRIKAHSNQTQQLQWRERDRRTSPQHDNQATTEATTDKPEENSPPTHIIPPLERNLAEVDYPHTPNFRRLKKSWRNSGNSHSSTLTVMIQWRRQLEFKESSMGKKKD